MKEIPSLDLEYRDASHRDLPHVVKFSGGRSSAMLLFALLANRQLDPKRGDVIVFNNTSAEHIRTYDFVIQCKKEAERLGNIPFFLTEFQTYETARDGYWRRTKSWRLVKPYLWSRKRFLGMRCRGEVFEEAIAVNHRLPNRFQRLCTDHLKVQVTRQMLSEWFSGKTRTQRQGHHHDSSMMTDSEIIRAYQGSSLSDQDLLQYVQFLRDCPWVREAQCFADYTTAPRLAVEHLQARAFDGFVPMSGQAAVPYIAIMGLRADEPVRVSSIMQRQQGDGAIPYFPLFDAGIFSETVHAFWQEQEWDLQLDSRYSNCSFCFMKSVRNLRAIAKDPGTRAQGPSQLDWWIDLESRYLRTVDEVVNGQNTGKQVRFGFFGRHSRHSYANLLELSPDDIPVQEPPCICTD